MDISGWIDKWAASSPDKVAIRFEGAAITYGELAARISSLALAMRRELAVAAGDRVAHLGLNSPDMLVLLFACARLGAILTPLNWRLAAPEHDYMLRQSGARIVFADRDFQDHVDGLEALAGESRRVCLEAAPPRPGWIDFASLVRGGERDDDFEPLPANSPLLIVYTSGTTGRPKGAVLTHEALDCNARNSVAAHGLVSSDHILSTLPMFHVGGLNIQTTPALYAGATVTLHRKFDAAAALRAITGERPTLTVLVPAQMAAIIDHPDWPGADLSSLRMLTTGSSIVPTHLIDAWHQRGVPVVQIYGSTETAPYAIHQTRDQAFSTVGSTGKAAKYCDIRLVDEQGRDAAAGVRGEILVRGANVMTGYWDDPGSTAEALRGGWFHSGDIAYQDDDGFFYVVDRKKDMIISGGENIYPAELEAVLHAHGDIGEAAVVGRADRRWGEIAVAVIVAREGSDLTKSAVLALFEDRLARYKHPRDVIFTAALPRNAMGKIVKYKIREMVASGEIGGPD